MGYSYNPIVGENWRYNPDKTFKLVDQKLELYLIVLPVLLKMQKLRFEKTNLCLDGQSIALLMIY